MDDDVTRPRQRRRDPDLMGPFRLLRLLGSGGMGSVHVAELLEPRTYGDPGDRFALKLLHPEELARPGAFQLALREASIGMRLRHPSVVRIHEFDACQVAGVLQHYLVMQLVEGRHLDGMLRDLAPLPEPLVRSIGAQIAEALHALHSAGIVHRDLKPLNVVITESQRVTLVDLGVALDETALPNPMTRGTGIGTRGWAAPEQVLGRATPLSDLYALGLVLFQAITGQHALEPRPGQPQGPGPPRAGQVLGGISPFLDELIDWLLHEDPTSRPASAQLVAELLEKGESSSWWTQRERSLRRDDPAGALRRARAPPAIRLVGRETELAWLAQAWREARAGRGACVLVAGEPGIGKTRLVQELAAAADATSCRVLVGAERQGGAFGALGAAILEALGDTGLEESLASRLEGPARALALPLAALLRGLAPSASAGPPAGVLASALARIVRAMAAESPMLLIVEDVHAASAEEDAALLAIAELARTAPLLLVATSRSAEWPELLPLAALPGLHVMELPRLPEESVRCLVLAATGSLPIAEALGQRLALRSDGNPYFVLQFLGELESSQALRRTTGGGLEGMTDLAEISMPGSLRTLVRSRLASLGSDDRMLLEAAAIEGFAFDPDLTWRVLGRRKLAVLQDLARLARGTGLVQPDGARFRFDHHQLHEALLDEMPALLSAEYHGLLAQAWAEREQIDLESGDLPPGAAALLAPHLLKSGERRHWRRFVLAALDHLAAQHRSAEALELGRLAFEALSDDPALRAEIALRRSERFELIGLRARQLEASEAAIAAARAAGRDDLLTRSHVALGRALAASGDQAEAERVLRKAARHVAGDARLGTRAFGALGQLLIDQRRFDEAEPHVERALELARTAGRGKDLSWSLSRLAQLRQAQGRGDEAIDLLHEALPLAQEAGDAWRLATAQGNLARAHGIAGRHDEARTILERQIVLCREIGYRKGEAAATGNLGLSLLEGGRLDDARTCFERQAALMESLGWALGEAKAHGHHAEALQGLGQPDRALEAAGSELRIARAAADPALEACALSRRARLHLECGALDDALGDAREARRVSESAKACRFGAIAAITEASALAHLGRAGELDAAGLHAAVDGLRQTATQGELARGLNVAADAWLGAGRGEEARACLAEAAELARRHDLVDPGAEPGARLLSLGQPTVLPDGPICERGGLLSRAAAATWLGLASRDVSLLDEAASLLESHASGFASEAPRERFRRQAPLSRALEEARRRLAPAEGAQPPPPPPGEESPPESSPHPSAPE